MRCGGSGRNSRRSRAWPKLLDEEWLKKTPTPSSPPPSPWGQQTSQRTPKKFADEDEPDYLLMSVTKARQMGILPIGFKSNATFAPVDAEE